MVASQSLEWFPFVREFGTIHGDISVPPLYLSSCFNWKKPELSMAFVILVVEDNEMNRDMLVRRLQKRDFQILTAADGEAALEIAFRDRPDLILMDMRMPVMDGWTAVKKLKDTLETRAIPVIGVSANGLQEDRIEALAAGCDAYETKPIDFNRLLTLIQEFTKKAS
jgi:two-component system, cell cycle response regulator DivK